MNHYMQTLINNYPLVGSAKHKHRKSQKYMQYGGSNNSHDYPTGGFPPIWFCNNDESQLIEDANKNREYSTHNTSISIAEIMKKKRDPVAFIKI